VTGNTKKWMNAVVVLAVVLVAVIVGIAAKHEPDWFNWEVAALSLAGFGTLVLGIATFQLANQPEIERRRRPRLSLLPDTAKAHSYPEGDHTIYVRLLVHNEADTRAAAGTRVLFAQLVRPGLEQNPVTFGSPYFGWTSARALDESVVIFAGASRVIDLAELRRDPGDKPLPFNNQFPDDTVAWKLRLQLPGVGEIPHQRQWAGTGTTFRLVLGSDEAETRFYDVAVYWNETAPDIDSVFNGLTVNVTNAAPNIATPAEPVV